MLSHQYQSQPLQYQSQPLNGMEQQDNNHHVADSTCWHMPQAHEPPISFALPYQGVHQPDTVTFSTVNDVAAPGHLHGSNVHTETATAGMGHGQHLFPTWMHVSPVPITTDSSPVIMSGQQYLKNELQTSALPLNGCNGSPKIKRRLCDLRSLQPLPINAFDSATLQDNQPLAAPGPGIQLQKDHESCVPMDIPGSIRPYYESPAGFQEMAWMGNGGHSLGGYEPPVAVSGQNMGAGEESMRVPPRRNIFRRRFPLLTSMIFGAEEASCESQTDYSMPTSLPESIGRRMRVKLRPSDSNVTARVTGSGFGNAPDNSAHAQSFRNGVSLRNVFGSSHRWEGNKRSKERSVRVEKGTFVVNEDYTQDALKRVGRALRFLSAATPTNAHI